jgi:glycogen operon protein
MCFNAHHEPLEFIIPTDYGERWTPVLDTSILSDDDAEDLTMKEGDHFTVPGRALVVLQLERTPEAE